MGLFFCAVVCLFKNEFECIVEWRICLSESVKCWCYTRYNETHHTALRQHSQRKKGGMVRFHTTATELYIDSVYVHMQKGLPRGRWCEWI